MASNVLTGVIKITTPGVQQTFTAVQSNIKKTEVQLKSLGTTSTQGFGAIGTGASKALSGLRLFANIIPGLGIAGIFALAIPAVSKLITGVSSLTEAQKKLKKISDDLGKSIAGELAPLTTLVGVIQNVNTSNKDRVDALRAINEQYGKYLPNLDKEKITVENLAASYDLITQALLRQAVVKGVQKEIEELVSKTAASITRISIEEEKRAETIKNSAKFQKVAIDPLKQYNTTIKDGQIALQGQRNELLKAGGDYLSFEGRVATLTKKLQEQLAPLLNLTTKFGDLDIKLNKVKVDEIKQDFFNPLMNLLQRVPFTISDVPVDIGRLNLIQIQSDKLKTFKELVEEKIVKQLQDLVIEPKFKIAIPPKAETEAAKAAEKLLNNFKDVVTSGIEDAFASIGEAIGGALSGEKGFGTQIFKIIGQFLVQIGKAMIAFGGIKKTVDKLLTQWEIPGGVAIALGIFAIAAGTALKSIKGARALGGPVTAGDSFLVGERGPELFTPNTGGQIIPNNRLGGIGAGGGGMMFQVIGTNIIQGQDLLQVFTLAQQSQRRLQ